MNHRGDRPIGYVCMCIDFSCDKSRRRLHQLVSAVQQAGSVSPSLCVDIDVIIGKGLVLLYARVPAPTAVCTVGVMLVEARLNHHSTYSNTSIHPRPPQSTTYTAGRLTSNHTTYIHSSVVLRTTWYVNTITEELSSLLDEPFEPRNIELKQLLYHQHQSYRETTVT